MESPSPAPRRRQPQQGVRLPLPLGHKPRRRKARRDDLRAAVEHSLTNDPEREDDEPEE